MKHFCLIGFQTGKPASAERIRAVNDGDAVRAALRHETSPSYRIFEGRRLVAVMEDGLVTMPRREPLAPDRAFQLSQGSAGPSASVWPA
jgi:hypothetical protein